MELHVNDRPTPGAMLSKRMRLLREASGLSLRGLAEKIHMPFGFLGRVERGEQPATETLVRELDTLFDTQGLFTELLEIVHESSIPEYSRDFMNEERRAVRIQIFTSSLIPGLLQTVDYAREVFRTGLPGKSTEDIEARVAIRMKRQRILERVEPPFYWAIMDEAALKRPTANRQFMRAQIEHLLRVASNPHVMVQVLPFEQAFYPMLGGSLTLLTLEDGRTVALVESFDSGEPVDSPKRVGNLVQRFDVVRSKALPEDESLEVIRHYQKEYEGD